jgi:hypothetical protein
MSSPGIPGPPGRVIGEEGAGFVLYLGADQVHPELFEATRNHLGDGERLALLGPVLVVSLGHRHSADVIEVTDQHVEVVPGLDVVVAVGVLANAREYLPRLRPWRVNSWAISARSWHDPGNLGPLLDGMLVGAVKEDLQTALALILAGLPSLSTPSISASTSSRLPRVFSVVGQSDRLSSCSTTKGSNFHAPEPSALSRSSGFNPGRSRASVAR